MDLLFHFLFAFAIYPIARLYWKKVFIPSFSWGGNWINYTTQAVGWLLIPLWLYWGYSLSGFLGFAYGGYLPRAIESLVGVYALVWFAVVVGMAVYAWIRVDEEYESHGRKSNADATPPKTKLPAFMQEYLDSVRKEPEKEADTSGTKTPSSTQEYIREESKKKIDHSTDAKYFIDKYSKK